MRDINKVIELDPDFVKALWSRSYIHEKLGDINQAVKDLNKSIELAPELQKDIELALEMRRLKNNPSYMN